MKDKILKILPASAQTYNNFYTQLEIILHECRLGVDESDSDDSYQFYMLLALLKNRGTVVLFGTKGEVVGFKEGLPLLGSSDTDLIVEGINTVLKETGTNQKSLVKHGVKVEDSTDDYAIKATMNWHLMDIATHMKGIADKYAPFMRFIPKLNMIEFGNENFNVRIIPIREEENRFAPYTFYFNLLVNTAPHFEYPKAGSETEDKTYASAEEAMRTAINLARSTLSAASAKSK